jgi:glycosyltransferase involved in cell wall biosynthesis
MQLFLFWVEPFKRIYEGENANMKISIIVPTLKNEPLTTKSLFHCPVPYQLILSKKPGLGCARNYGAKQAKYDLLVFLDDDLTLKPEIWKHILNTRKGEFKMTKWPRPVTRAMVIHSEDFWRVGGFDESIKALGEDLVFYVEAIQHGLNFSEIPIGLMIHEDHEPRSHNKRVAIDMILDTSRNFARYGFRLYGLTEFARNSVLREMLLRSFVIRLSSFTYYAFKMMLTENIHKS